MTRNELIKLLEEPQNKKAPIVTNSARVLTAEGENWYIVSLVVRTNDVFEEGPIERTN